jgi:hypothetical protein
MRWVATLACDSIAQRFALVPGVDSFQFEWPRFSESFHRDACQMLDAALNKGNKPPIIADRIEVVELEMGKQVRAYQLRTFYSTFC